MYEVYMCKVGSEIVYIGQGKIGRSRHCVSGISHVYGLNKLHFSEMRDSVEVNVIKFFLSKDDALKFELDLIKKHLPRFNTVHKPSKSNNDLKNFSHYRRTMFDTPENMTDNHFDLYKKLYREFFDFYQYKNSISGNIVIYSIDHFLSIEKLNLSKLSRSLRERDGTYSDRHFCTIFKKNFVKSFGYCLSDKLHNKTNPLSV